MTGAKVFAIYKRFGPDELEEYSPLTSTRSRGSSRPKTYQQNTINYSSLFYQGHLRYRPGELKGIYLQSPQQRTIWWESRLEAKIDHPEKVAIGPGYGIHAYRTLRAAVAYQHNQDHSADHPGQEAAYAIVQPDGKVAIGEYGWVAAAATIVRIYLSPRDYLQFGRALYETYRIPVEVLPQSLREPVIPPRNSDPWPFQIWNRRYGPKSGAYLWRHWKTQRLTLELPRKVRKAPNLALWDPDVAAIGQLRIAMRLTVRERGRLGGLARSKALRSGNATLSGAAVPKQTPCPRCHLLLSSAREAWRHCRTGKPGRPPKESLTR